MGRATLSWKIPDEREDFELAQKAVSLKSALFEVDQWLRQKLKYDDKLSDQEREIYQTVRDQFFLILSQEGVEL